MSILRVYSPGQKNYQEYTALAEISRILAAAGIRFEQWEAEKQLATDSGQEEILTAYAGQVEKLKKASGFTTADVVSLNPQSNGHAEMRKKFLDEHTHSDDEARFFVDGSGLFWIHGENDAIYGLLCEKGDLINVPANVRHWFDMGPAPHFKCIRVFTSAEGWVGHFTGSEIARQYPLFEQFTQA